MNSAIWTVARRLALSADRRQRWRQISVIAGATVATCAALLGMSIIHLGMQVSEHTDARHPVNVAADQDGKAAVKVTGPILPEVSQFPMMWISPMPGFESDPSIVPPGLSAIPGPGEAVLSPGLLDRGYTAEDFGFAAGDTGTGRDGAIGDEGLASRSEGFVYVRTAEDRPLTGRSPAMISGFGTSGPHYPVEMSLDVPVAEGAIVGSVWLVIIPALFVMTGAARAVSQVRSQRAETLWRLGVARRRVAQLVALETGLLAALGSALGAAMWAAFFASRTQLPGVDADLLPRSLTLPLPVVTAGAAMIVLNATVAALWAKQKQAKAHAGNSLLWALPFVVCLATMALAGIAPRLLGQESAYDLGVAVLMVAGACATIALPMAIPALLGGMATVGRLLRKPTAWLAGRLVVTRRSTLARPAMMAAVLVYLAGATTAMTQGLVTNSPVSVLPTADREVWAVNWVDPRAGDIGTVIDNAEKAGAIALPVLPSGEPSQEDLMSGLPPANGVVTVNDCAAARDFFGLAEAQMTCTDQRASADGLFYDVALGAPEGVDVPRGSTEVLLSTPPGWTDGDAIAVFAGLPAVNAWKVAGQSEFFSPAYDWFAAAMLTATLLLTVGLVREIGDRVIVVVGERSRLLRAGLRAEEADKVYTLATMLPMLVALPLGYLAARVFAANGVGYLVTADSIDVIAIVAIGVAALTAGIIGVTLWWQRRMDGGVS